MTRDPCPYCGMQNIALSRVDPWINQEVRDIKEHDCSYWAPKPPLDPEPTDTSFIREARNTPEGLKAWRESLRPKGTDQEATCGICDQRVGIAYDEWVRHLQTCPPQGVEA